MQKAITDKFENNGKSKTQESIAKLINKSTEDLQINKLKSSKEIEVIKN